ncbi:Rho GTPase activating protein 39, partial [Coemansia spiralis]
HLTAQIVRLGGRRTEGLFRVPADADAIAMARLRLEAGCLDAPRDGDPNVPASLLKEWFRDLAEPLIPEALYAHCVTDPTDTAAVLARMPPVSLRVLQFLIAFLASLLRPDVQARTKMGAANLALIFGPTLLRNPASDLRDAFVSSSAEQRFVMALLGQPI